MLGIFLLILKLPEDKEYFGQDKIFCYKRFWNDFKFVKRDCLKKVINIERME